MNKNPVLFKCVTSKNTASHLWKLIILLCVDFGSGNEFTQFTSEYLFLSTGKLVWVVPCPGDLRQLTKLKSKS